MSCEGEKKALQDALQRVRSLRQTLEDMTGSNKPGDGAPSGNWPEGTNEANEELQEVRENLQNALERLSEARVNLANCTGKPVNYSDY